MKKGIEFTSSQVKAFENGATMFMIPISKDTQAWLKNRDLAFIEVFAPIQKGDEFFIKEEFAELLEDVDDIDSEMIYYRAEGEIEDCVDTDYEPIDTPWKPASQMQEHQSRHKNIKCIDVRVARVGDLTIVDAEKILEKDKSFFKDKFSYATNISIGIRKHLKTLSENPSMEDNIFLIEVKR